jgi:hypothetical protein
VSSTRKIANPKAKKASAKTSTAKKAIAKKATAKKATAKKATKALKAARAKKAAAPARRADFGAPIDGFFAKQPAHLRAVLEALRELVEDAAPDATAAIKWGMPFYSIGTGMMCALGAHKAHVNLILSGPPGTYADPRGLLEAEGKTGRHLKLLSIDGLPRDAVRGWLQTAARVARERQGKGE